VGEPHRPYALFLGEGAPFKTATLRPCRPDKLGPKAFEHWPAVVGFFVALLLIPKRMVAGLREGGVIIAHDVRHRDADALLFVVQHQHRAAIGAEADFQRAIGVVGIERHTLHLFGVVGLQVGVVEKGDMGVLLTGDGFADIAVTFMVINRFCGSGHMHMRAAPGIFCGHTILP